MTKEQKAEITRVSKEFAEPFYEMFGGINNTGWLIVDPLAGYLNSIGHENTLHELPQCEKHPQVLVLTFKDGSQLIPAGADLKPVLDGIENWQWV